MVQDEGLLFSNLIRYQLVAGNTAPTPIFDYAIQLTTSPYPPVTHLLIQQKGKIITSLPWEKVKRINHTQGLLWAADLEGAVPVKAGWIEKAVLLKRDILDAIMLDLQQRTPILANDLGLDDHEGTLSLTSVDISFGAILRRLTGGLIDRRPGPHLHDWRYIEFLRGNPEAARQGLEYHGLITRLPPGEIAFLANHLPYLYAAELITLLPDILAADTLELIQPILQREAFEELDEKKAGKLLSLMRPDIVSDLLTGLGPEEAKYWLERLPRAQADRILGLMQYPAETAGGMMTNDIITLPVETKIGEAVNILREKLRLTAYINFIQMVYVVDSESKERLQGALSLRDMLVADGEATLGEVMNPYLFTLLPTEEAKAAARRIVESGLPAIPVIGDEGRILGVVSIDTALSTLLPERTRRPVLRLFS